FVRTITYHDLAYASRVIPEIADLPKAIDDAMRWGFAHKAGPFELWDGLGVAETAEQMKQAGFAPAAWVDEMLAAGHETFYQYQNSTKVGIYNPVDKKYVPIEISPKIINLKAKTEAGKVITRNPGATLIDIGDGVALVTFDTKMGALDDDISKMVNEALDRAESDFEGVVLSHDGDNFSAGANLAMVLMAAKSGMWPLLEQAIDGLQGVNMRMRYFPKPVVVAPFGYTFGGGCEVTMHAPRVVAAAELYIGLVEVGVGVIPAGGGTKEIMRRFVNPHMRISDSDYLPPLQKAFEQIGMAKVVTSALEAQSMGILGSCDRVVMNRDYLIAEAKREVLHMAESGYAPPVPEKIYAAGRDALAALRVGLHMFKEGGYISEYDAVIGEKLITILAGGELSKPAWVSEQYILDLEKEAFLSLCGEEKTQERIYHMLETGKPLRN
ncbi:MAG: enoyl-CoA hydratase/isomerase family protein, partial [Anaerolineales bacterium]|nr:enoyl-CoA hydratase/isomerase family protein [Anaerolineales bacterium]